MAGPNCHRCSHFRVTWDAAFPYECRAYGFRSRRVPSVVVLETSGQPCQLFTRKPRTTGPNPSPTEP